MNVCRGMFLVAALCGFSGCDNKDKETEATNTTTTSTAATTPPPPADAAAQTTVKPEEPAKPKIEPRVKAELDNRADGITGTALAVTGAKASLQTPTGWQTTKGEFNVTSSPDKKAQLAAGSFTTAEGPTAKLPGAVAALGLTNCEWAPAETVTAGKTKLPAAAADGVCTRGATQVRAAYVAPQAEDLLVVGAWDPDGDSANVFGSMRSIAKAGTGDASGIAACCAALRGNAKVAPPEQQAAYMMAAGACDAIKNDPNGRAALSQVRAALAGAQMPSSCR